MTTTTSSAPEIPASLRLLEEFEPHTYEQWKQAAEDLLKGASFEKKLVTQTYEGFDIQPIYLKQDIENLPHLGGMPGMGQRVRGANTSGYINRPWSISQEAVNSLPEQANLKALQGLQRGESELNLPLDSAARQGLDPDQSTSGHVGLKGISIAHKSDFDTLYQGIHPDWISNFLTLGASGLAASSLLVAFYKDQNLPLETLQGCLGSDPLGELVEKGISVTSLKHQFDEMAAITQYCSENLPKFQTVLVQGHPYHNGGAGIVQELGFTMATGVAYLREMMQRGLTIDQAAPRFRFAFSIGSNTFMEIAKLRAARLLWAQIVEHFGGSDSSRSMHIHARTSLWNKTVYDPYVNILRTTTEAFSAVIGGCNSMHVGGFDEVARVSDDTALRIARNLQIVLMEECELTHVTDPGGGSYTIEWLTDQFANRGWEMFQSIEREGGMIQALKNGSPQKLVGDSADDRRANIERRKDVFVGTNMFPNPTEKPLPENEPDYQQIFEKRSQDINKVRSQRDQNAVKQALQQLKSDWATGSTAAMAAAVQAAQAGATLNEISSAVRPASTEVDSIKAIPFKRGAALIESLRQQVETARAKGANVKLLQANIGPSRGYRLRADWTSSFFQVGGLEVLNTMDFDSTQAALQCAQQVQPPIVVITSDDATYETAVPELAAQLRQSQPEAIILVAGAPGEQEQAWRSAGVDDFVSARSNNYQMLNSLLTKIGVIS